MPSILPFLLYLSLHILREKKSQAEKDEEKQRKENPSLTQYIESCPQFLPFFLSLTHSVYLVAVLPPPQDLVIGIMVHDDVIITSKIY